MRGSYCYMPILPARYGAFRAVASLSPIGRSRIAPMFDVPNVVLKANQTVDSYLEKRAREIRNCWEADASAPELPLCGSVTIQTITWSSSLSKCGMS